MSQHPIDVIAQAIREADTNGQHLTADALARWIATEALTHDAIVANAVQALKASEWWALTSDGTGLGDEDFADIARVVLGSVGGAS